MTGALRAFVVKELRHILRDRQTLTVLLLMPLVQVVLFGYALRSDVRNIRLVVVDPVPDASTLALANRFAGTDRFRIVARTPSLAAAEPLFRQTKVDVALVFEHGFSEDLHSNQPAHVLLAIDASDPNTGTTMEAYARAVITTNQDELAAEDGTVGHPERSEGSALPAVRGQQPIRIRPEIRMRFNPTLESVNLFVPGLIALVLTLVSALMTAISLSREKERGTLEVLLVSPLRPWQVIVGKVVPYLGLAFANAVTALCAAWFIFRVPLEGSVVLLLTLSMLFAIVSLALGVLIASRTSSQRTAMFAAMIGTMLPSTLLSGMIFPITSMPRPLQLLSNIVPARWFIIVARGIMLKGVGLEYLWREALILTVMTLLLLTAAIRSFKPRIA
ncbi:MAG TPA: ABC transporter permease [Gemmatimonadaceae bacterium]